MNIQPIRLTSGLTPYRRFTYEGIHLSEFIIRRTFDGRVIWRIDGVDEELQKKLNGPVVGCEFYYGFNMMGECPGIFGQPYNPSLEFARDRIEHTIGKTFRLWDHIIRYYPIDKEHN